jgi:uncharacterized protein DUF2868
MDETTARHLSAARAIESTDRDRAWWTDDDRAWASRAAAETVGADAPPQRFLACRAEVVLERAHERAPVVSRAVHALAWRGWITFAALAAAFVAGLMLDQVGPAGRIDILAPPVLGLLMWNAAVYVVLLSRLLRPQREQRASATHAAASMSGLVRAGLLRLATGGLQRRPPRVPSSGPAAAVAAFVRDWSVQAGPLYAARAARILHLAAAVLALGVIAGLYLRGLALEYRAGWESTFLDAAAVHRILAIVLAPGAALTGLPVPDVQHVASIRRDVLPQGENAARWVHLLAATVLLVVIVPRLLLAMVAAGIERRRVRALGPDLAAPYYRRVLRDFSAAPPAVLVVPCSYTVAPQVQAQLRRVLARAFGAAAQVVIAPSVPYGSEDRLPAALTTAGADVAIALFNAVATPEAESQGAFVDALRATGAPERVALVDEGRFRARWPGETVRLTARREAWQAVLEARDVRVVFADLMQPDLAEAEAALNRSLGESR